MRQPVIAFIVLLASLLAAIPQNAFAQKEIIASGEYIYYSPEDVSPKQAKQNALDRAKIQIIGDNFGTVVGVTNLTNVSNTDGVSSTKFLSLGESEVKGEWLETIGEPKFETSYIKDQLVVKVTVKGRIREIKSAAVDLDVRILRGGKDDRNESELFFSGDDIYASFKSPVSGYVAIYLYNNADGVNRLLPAIGQEEGSVSVKSGKRYVFFDNGEGRSEYYMTCEGELEWNRIYVIFSPNFFARPNDNVEEGKPASLSFDDFQKWLTKCRRKDTQMTCVIKEIKIQSR